MKVYTKAIGFVLIFAILFVLVAYEHFDKPLINCQQYVEVNHLNKEMCRE